MSVMAPMLRHTKLRQSSEVSTYGNDFVFRIQQHAEMPKKNRFGIVNSRIPLRFRELRQRRDLTQEELANQLGTTKTRISRKETGKEPFSSYFLEAFAKAVNEPPAALVASDTLAKLLEAFAKCHPEEQRHFLLNIQRAAGTASSGAEIAPIPAISAPPQPRNRVRPASARPGRR